MQKFSPPNILACLLVICLATPPLRAADAAAALQVPTASAQTASLPVASAPPTAEVQSLLLRAVSVTYDLERSLLFYRDILNQEIVEDATLSTERAQTWLDITPQAQVRFVVLRGRGEYPGGPIAGGRIAFIGIREPNRKAAAAAHPNRRGAQGDMILPHRVKGLDSIYAKLQAGGFEILFAPRVTPTGLSRNMMVFDPNGHIVELFEMK